MGEEFEERTRVLSSQLVEWLSYETHTHTHTPNAVRRDGPQKPIIFRIVFLQGSSWGKENWRGGQLRTDA